MARGSRNGRGTGVLPAIVLTFSTAAVAIACVGMKPLPGANATDAPDGEDRYAGVTGMVVIDGDTYYMRDGERCHGLVEMGDGKRYFDDETGRMLTGWQMTRDGIRHFGDDGVMDVGVATLTGTGGEPGKWILDEETGVAATGWQKIAGKQVFCSKKDGHVLTGVAHDIDGKGTWAFDEDGVSVRGWRVLENVGDCYFDPKTGRMLTGLARVPSPAGKATGFAYFDPNTGAAATGWLDVPGHGRMLFDSSTHLTVIGFVADGDDVYYLDRKTGVMATGWVKVDGHDRYFGDDGKMSHGVMENVPCRDGVKRWVAFASDGVVTGTGRQQGDTR